MSKAERAQDEAARFERFPTTTVALGPLCSCWARMAGPWAVHPAGCLCLCHGGRR